MIGWRQSCVAVYLFDSPLLARVSLSLINKRGGVNVYVRPRTLISEKICVRRAEKDVSEKEESEWPRWLLSS